MILCDIHKVHEISDKIDLGPSKYTRSKTFSGAVHTRFLIRTLNVQSG